MKPEKPTHHRFNRYQRLGITLSAVALAGLALEGPKVVSAAQRSHTIARHIAHPNTIPVNEAAAFIVPFDGSGPQALAKKLAPDSSQKQASMATELEHEEPSGILPGGVIVKVDSSFVETHPADITFVDPATLQPINPATK